MKIRIIVGGLLFFTACLVNVGCQSDAKSGASSDTESKAKMNSSNSSSDLITGWYYVVDENTAGAIAKNLVKSKDPKSYYLDPSPIVTAQNIQSAEVYPGFMGAQVIKMSLDAKGIDKWATATEKHVRKYVAFILNGDLIVVQRIAAKDETGNTSVSRKEFDEQEFQKMFDDIQASIPKDANRKE